MMLMTPEMAPMIGLNAMMRVIILTKSFVAVTSYHRQVLMGE